MQLSISRRDVVNFKLKLFQAIKVRLKLCSGNISTYQKRENSAFSPMTYSIAIIGWDLRPLPENIVGTLQLHVYLTILTLNRYHLINLYNQNEYVPFI